MTETLKLSFLGKPRVALGETEMTEKVTGKVQALLCYLAITRRPHSRMVLADLLWGEMPEESARSNLRMALSSLRRSLEPYLTIARDALAFDKESPLWLDVEEFERLIAPTLRASGRALSHEQIASLTEAIRLYRGDFLEGFYVRDAPAFEEWVLTQRERLRQLALQALNWLAVHHIEQQEYGVAIDYTARLLALEPWLEEAHRQMMQLLALRGQQGAALAQYEICRRLLEEELGVEPSRETTTLYEQIRQGQVGPKVREPELAPLVVEATHNLPTQLTPFFGREEELARISEHLGDPNYRLLSIVGPGGIGKTRLALQVGTQQLEAFANRVYFVPLADVPSPDLIVPAIAESINFTFQGTEPPKTQLLNFLRDKEMLLVLDNFEHLVDGADLVLEILRKTKRLAILLTSRERLSLQAEVVFDLKGLPCPPEIDDPNAMAYSAVRLFAERAGRASMGFEPTAETLRDVVRICHLVEGRPLGLELAAAWVGEYSCAEIAAAIQRNLDFLATSMRDLPARHRSIRAVFEHSWELLEQNERTLLSRLSVFRGGFQPESARAVAQASPALLAALKRKSLVRETPAHRFHLHELVRQYADEKLQEADDVWEQTHQRHAAHYATFLQAREDMLKGGDQSAAMDEIRREIENVQAGWGWVVGQLEGIDDYLDGLYLFCDTRNLLQEGEEAFNQAMAAMRRTNSNPDALVTRGRLLTRQGHFARRRGLYDRARTLLEESVRILRPLDNRVELAFALSILGQILHRQGEYEAAKQILQESIDLYQQTGDEWGKANALNNLGMVVDVDDYDGGQALFKASYEIRKTLGDRRGMALCLNNWGVSVEMQHRYTRAMELYEESLSLTRAIGDQWILGMVLSNLGDMATTMGEYPAARRYYAESLEGASKLGAVPEVVLILVKIAALLIQEERVDEALELLGVALHHPTITHGGETRDYAEKLVSELAVTLPDETIAGGLEQGRKRDLDDVVQQILTRDFAKHHLAA